MLLPGVLEYRSCPSLPAFYGGANAIGSPSEIKESVAAVKALGRPGVV